MSEPKLRRQFKRVARPCGDALLHKWKPVWIVEYHGIKGVRRTFWQVYYSCIEVPKDRQPWSVDNKCVGALEGFPSLEAALIAAVFKVGELP